MKRPFSVAGSRIAAGLLCILLAGCATYHSRPLPVAPDLTRAPQLMIPASQFQLPGLAPHAIPRKGLDQATILLLAVCNDPDLKAARLQAGIARAQMLQAGLLPNPTFNAGFAQSARTYGGALGLSEDLQALITRGATRAAASAAQQQVHLNILWQEWQVAAKANQAFLEARGNARQITLQRVEEHLLASRYQADRKAMQQGDMLSTTVSADLVQFSNAQDRLRQLQLAQNSTMHQLKQLLGLKPGAPLQLLGTPSASGLSPSQFHSALAALPHRRADLLALQAGYQSQQAALRRAILMQFPALSVGVNIERDPVEGVNSLGPEANLSLPIFNHNQGSIAIQRATRAYLWQTYQARLDAAVSQAHELWKANQLLAAQLHTLRATLPRLKARAEAARQSLQQNDLDAAAYTVLEEGYLAKQQEAVQLQTSLAISRATLHMLLGLPIVTPAEHTRSR
ncbi:MULTISPECIES: TolC family protein [Acidobacterium]|uniref:Putative secretion protein n=1 Tax=Acidobacterium capsulatum (strain ATCC 51196 / DSM 11244 / BCRC 80197 / JCM 7670 / NBRC 15755 / NCIMB 13165 / 161) TaxID=240015 RepID=C1F8T2_ACIC5|nr:MULTISPECIES: TolC family protein [Acidobacterium]ACO33003.1 putative secretion protein [Acidobacterium capsulatum ATCC 51196]HCT59856.1 TolC family protein [Acidobacterium sp.]